MTSTLRVIVAVGFVVVLGSSAFAQTPAAPAPFDSLPLAQGKPDPQQPAPAPAPAQEEDDPDRDINFAQPDFALAALPTTLRVPRHKSAFRVTHRFGRPLGQGDFGDLISDLFGLDSGALIGLEYRFGLFRGTQIGIHRTSSKTISLFVQQSVKTQRDGFPFGLDVLATAEGEDNLTEHHSPSLGVILSREFADRGAVYIEPIWVHNSSGLPSELVDDNDTVLLGLGARLRIRPTVYVLLEGSPRIAGHDPNVTQVSFGIEKRMGGHSFQLNFSNGFGTTLGQIARGGGTNDDWYLGFNISRKFF